MIDRHYDGGGTLVTDPIMQLEIENERSDLCRCEFDIWLLEIGQSSSLYLYIKIMSRFFLEATDPASC